MKRLPQSEAQFNNGVQVSRDGRFAYFNAWVGKQIVTYDRKAQRIVNTAGLSFYPDNLTMRTDQTLVAAGIDDLGVFEACMALPWKAPATARINSRT